MFEFSFASLFLIAIVGAVAWHFYATKVLGYVSASESALRQDWQKFRAELTGAHTTLEAELNGRHDVTAARVTTIENVVTPAAAAGVTNATLPPKA